MFNNYTDEEVPSYENCSVIQPPSNGNGSLLIGDFNSATDSETIKLHNIKTIVTAAAGMQHLHVPGNVLHITYPLLDANSENIKRFFDQSTQMIKTNLKNGSVLVHCAAGISRSATLVIAYLMKTRKMTFKEAIAYVRINRNVRPNLGFERQLKIYEKQLFDNQENKLGLKKTITQKLAEQRRTSYNRSSTLGKPIYDYLKIQPRTAQQTKRKNNNNAGILKKLNLPYTDTRPRDRRNFKVRALGKEGMFILGQGQIPSKEASLQESIGNSEHIKPPIIQNHHKNAINNAWIKIYSRRNY